MIAQLAILVCLGLARCTEGAKVLLLTGGVPSQCLQIAPIGQELVRRGHEVKVYLPDYYESEKCFGNTQIGILRFPTTEKQRMTVQASIHNMSVDIFRDSGQSNFLKELRELIKTICESVLTKNLETLRKEKFDILVANPVPPCKCYSLVSAFLDIPLVAVAVLADPFESFYPFPASYHPHLMSTVDTTHSFKDRFINTLFYLGFRFVAWSFGRDFDPNQGGLDLSNFSSTSEVRDAVLYIENSDYVINGPKAVFPNFIHAGGLTARPPNKLPAPLEQFFNSASDGVVIAAFGSILRAAPDALIDKLVSALSRLKQKVVMNYKEEKQIKNIRMISWLPMNDVLGHPKTRAFLSHCGMNSFWESLYHGIPIVCSAMNADAYAFAARAIRKGFGVKIDVRHSSADDIYEALRTVVENESFRKNAKKQSDLLRDRPETPAQRAAGAIEHVLKYGGDHLRSEVASDLNFFQYLLLDVWLAFLAIFLIMCAVVVTIIRCVRKVCCGTRKVKEE